MTKQTRCIKITPDGSITEVSQQQENDDTAYRTQCCWSLTVPEQWEHNKFRLARTMLDTFKEYDFLNILATMLFRKLRSLLHELDDVICGTVYFANETVDNIIDSQWTSTFIYGIVYSVSSSSYLHGMHLLNRLCSEVVRFISSNILTVRLFSPQ